MALCFAIQDTNQGEYNDAAAIGGRQRKVLYASGTFCTQVSESIQNPKRQYAIGMPRTSN